MKRTLVWVLLATLTSFVCVPVSRATIAPVLTATSMPVATAIDIQGQGTVEKGISSDGQTLALGSRDTTLRGG